MILQFVPVKRCERTTGSRENIPRTSSNPNTGPTALSRRPTFRRWNREGLSMRGSGRLSDSGGHQGVFVPVTGGTNGRERAAAHHADGVAHTQQFGQGGTDEEDRFALRRQ